MIKAIKNLFKIGHTFSVVATTSRKELSAFEEALVRMENRGEFYNLPIGATVQHESPYSAVRSFVNMFNCRNDLNVSPEDTRFWC